MALKDLFSSIADAIREKDGTTAEITASTFPDRIRAIPTGVGGVQLESISITTPPTKTEYLVGDAFDPTGMVVQATFSNGQTMIVDNSNLTFDPSGELSVDTASVTVNFQLGLKMASASQSVTIFDLYWWSPKMTSNTAPAPYVATPNTEYKTAAGYISYGYYAFNGKHGDIVISAPVSWYAVSSAATMIFDCGEEMEIKGCRLFPDVNTNLYTLFPKAFRLEGSNDKSGWTEIVDVNYESTYDPLSHEWYELVLGASVIYRYYKFTFYAGSYALSNQVAVNEIEFLCPLEVTTE